MNRKKVHQELMEDWVKELESAIEYAESSIYPVLKERKEEIAIFPNGDFIYRAFKQCQFKDLRIILLGQDPYHNPGSATGLCFQVGNNNKLNPSVKNIMKELEIETQPDFDLWSKQGVLLLNTALTVEQGKAGSHTALWKPFTENVIKVINEKKDNIIWILWGGHALSFKNLITNATHKTIISSHPSPLGCDKFLKEYPPFRGNKFHLKVNDILTEKEEVNIKWYE